MEGGGAADRRANKTTSKHNIRYIPNMNGLDIVKKIRAQLDHNGYKDVELKLIGDVPWSKMNYNTDIQHAADSMMGTFGIPVRPRAEGASILGGYWPSYLFSNQQVGQKVGVASMPIGGGSVGRGGGGPPAQEGFVSGGGGE